MVRWQLTGIEGEMGGYPAAEMLAPGLDETPLVPDEQGQCLLVPRDDSPDYEHLLARVRALLDPSRPNWVVLPHVQREHRHWWEQQLASVAEPGFGRGSVALALSQMDRLATPARLIAVHRPDEDTPGIEGAIALDWHPTEERGLAFDLTRMDGRLDGKTDVGALLKLGRDTITQPEALLCPGTGGDGYLERLLPFLAELGPWAGQAVRWEFPEARLGRLGVVGSLYSWAWLEAGYRLGDWSAPCAILEMDDSEMVGLSVVRWQPS